MMDFENKTVLITGAAGAIGKGIAAGFCKGGAKAFSRGVGGKPSAIAFHPDGGQAWVLIGGIDHKGTCGGQSTLVRIVFPASNGIFNPVDKIQLPGRASDVEVHPRTGKLLVAMPCDGMIGQLPAVAAFPTPAQVSSIVKLPAPYDIAVTDDDIVVISKAQTSNRGQALLFSLEKDPPDPASALTRSFDLPSINLPVGEDSSPAGSFSWVFDSQGDLKVYNAEISPDGQRALVLYNVTFRSEIDTGSCRYNSSIAATGYSLVDLTDGSVLVNRLTKLVFNACSAPCLQAGGKSLSDPGVCESVFRNSLSKQGTLQPTPFEALGAALLFGGS